MEQERDPKLSSRARSSAGAHNSTGGSWTKAHEVPVSSAQSGWSQSGSAQDFTPRRMRRAQYQSEEDSTSAATAAPATSGNTASIPPRARHGERRRTHSEADIAALDASSTQLNARVNRATTRAAKRNMRGSAETKEDTSAQFNGYPSRRAQERGKRNQSASRTSKKTQKPRRRRPARFFLVVLIVAAVVAIGAFAFKAIGGTELFSGPKNYPGPGEGRVDITIPEGASGNDIANILFDKNVVASTGAFTNAFKDNPLAKGIQPGMYELKYHMSAREALQALLNANNRIEKKVTLVEGRRLSTFLKQLEEQKVFTKADIDQALSDTAALGLPAVAKGNLEGWLAPATYVVKPATTAADLFKEMIALTVKRLEEQGVPENQWQTILIKASIVEKEVHLPEYYGKVARVIDNRLELPNETGGYLGMDTTINYGLGREGGSPTKAELEKDTPYNSRLHKGLPPTPIGMVGEKALAAAAHPTPGPWLYFVTINLETGETVFSTTAADFEKQAEKLQQYCATHKGQC